MDTVTPKEYVGPTQAGPLDRATLSSNSDQTTGVDQENKEAIKKANGALVLMALGTAGSYWASRAFPSQGWLPLVASGFEAGVVGGLADWFAVEALFRRIPIPLVAQHTDVLRRKHKIVAERIANLVQHEWLTPRAIEDQLLDLSLSDRLGKMMQDPAESAEICESVRRISLELLSTINTASVAANLVPIARRFVAEGDLAGVLAHGVGKWIELGGDTFVWETASAPLAEFLESDAFRTTNAELLRDAARRWTPAFVAQLDSPFVVDSAAHLLDDLLNQPRMWAALGGMLRRLAESDRWDELTSELLADLPSLFKGKHGKQIAEWIEGEIDAYLNQSDGIWDWLKNAAKRSALFCSGDDPTSIADEVVSRLRAKTKQMAEDPDDPFRARIREAVIGFASRLEQSDPKALNSAQTWRAKNLDAQALRLLVAGAFSEIRGTLEAKISGANSSEWVSKLPWPEIAVTLGAELAAVLRGAAQEPNHPARKAVREILSSASSNLRNEESPARAKINALLIELLDHVRLEELLENILSSGLRSALEALQGPAGPGATQIRKGAEFAVEVLREDRALAQSFDDQARKFGAKLINENRDKIGTTVKDKLYGNGDAKDAALFVDQIRNATIADLQGIRLNGAVLGFLIGLILGAVKMVL